MHKLVGYPFRPSLTPKASCGAVALAALLGLNTDVAIEIMDKTYDKGWHGNTNVGHIKSGLKALGIKMYKTTLYDGMNLLPPTDWPLLVFIQIEGSWMGRHWRAEYTHTHWLLIDKNMVMDINNAPDVEMPWVGINQWMDDILPNILSLYEGKATGWHIKSAYTFLATYPGMEKIVWIFKEDLGRKMLEAPDGSVIYFDEINRGKSGGTIFPILKGQLVACLIGCSNIVIGIEHLIEGD